MEEEQKLFKEKLDGVGPLVADPSDKTPPLGKIHQIQKNERNFWTNNSILKSVWIKNILVNSEEGQATSHDAILIVQKILVTAGQKTPVVLKLQYI